MIKLVILLLVALCYTEKTLPVLSADNFGILGVKKFLEEKELIKFQTEFRDEIVKHFEYLSNYVENINYKKKVSQDIEANEISLKKIFKLAKEEIKKLSDASSFDECSEMAYEELDALSDKTKTDVANCIAKGDKKTSKVINDMKEKLIEDCKYLIEVYAVEVMKCAQKFRGEDQSQCINMEEGMEIKKELEIGTISAMKVGKTILEQVAEDVSQCLIDVKVDAIINTEHVSDEMKSCIN